MFGIANSNTSKVKSDSYFVLPMFGSGLICTLSNGPTRPYLPLFLSTKLWRRWHKSGTYKTSLTTAVLATFYKIITIINRLLKALNFDTANLSPWGGNGNFKSAIGIPALL